MDIFFSIYEMKKNYKINNCTNALFKLPANTAYTKLGISTVSTSEKETREIYIFKELDTKHLESLESEDTLSQAVKTNSIASKFDGCIQQ